ncbi:ATP-dependent nuclease [Marinicella gelatinilytica]|uniref:ATP-dependent nuclease n=1 Tax=Marinicella gelatinilytica TaxID=2996017 RepID=UPI002260EB47|nr:AAA family ATPase [Marinicella gelatinilytica]MCX7546294.1 AAA family ATPase [Marinicella gelatinilytica]
MKISFIEIRKFRSIDICKINIAELNGIVGQNNSGKSAIIRALNAFFNIEKELDYFKDGSHAYSSKSIPKITIGFTDINVDSLDEFKFNNVVQLQLVFQKNGKHSYKIFNSNKKFVNVSREQLDVILKSLAFVYIPPNRSPKQLKWDEDALIKKLIIEYLKIETQNRDTLSPKFKSATDYLEKKALKKISKDIKSFYSLRNTFEFHLEFNKDANFLSFLNEIEMKIDEMGVTHSLNDCGTGLQSLTIIALYRVLAKIKHQNIVLAIEEPETNLHPQAQREFVNSILDDTDGVSQLFLTTHSTVLIDNLKHQNISLVRKVHDDKRGFKSVVFKISDDFFDKYNLQEFLYYQFHNYRNSDFFFANYVILVESKNDAEVVKHLAGRSNLDLDLLGISLINFDGVKNLPYPFHIIKELDLPYMVILDKDYFLPYQNDDLHSSRDNQGLPKYKSEFKGDILLNDFVGTNRNQQRLLTNFRNSHTKAMNQLLERGVLCMKYCLEMDLLGSSKAVESMCDQLNIYGSNRTKKYLLLENHKAIKKIQNT